MKALTVGDRAPDVSAAAHDGRRVALSEFLGRKAVVLFFYPKDGTGVCTKEVCAFRDAYEDFVQAGAVVLGVSSDGEESHRRFAERQNLPFTLLSDPDKSLRRAFGVPKTFGLLPGRVTYVLDRDGIIRHVFNAQFTADRHVVEALAIVRQLAAP
ncbi:MAG: peroxiredoxin [Pirellula sp.]|nr:peroxiredoxin [Pirellula sp.]